MLGIPIDLLDGPLQPDVGEPLAGVFQVSSRRSASRWAIPSTPNAAIRVKAGAAAGNGEVRDIPEVAVKTCGDDHPGARNGASGIGTTGSGEGALTNSPAPTALPSSRARARIIPNAA